ncbi:hypothetical protein D3C79_679490 [compost metagenome]
MFARLLIEVAIVDCVLTNGVHINQTLQVVIPQRLVDLNVLLTAVLHAVKELPEGFLFPLLPTVNRWFGNAVVIKE